MRATWPRAVPIPPASDSQAPLELVRSSDKRPTPNDQLLGERLDCVNGQPHADGCDFQQDAKSDSSSHAAASETARIDHHECKNHKRLTDNDPVKQAHHFTLRPPEIWRFRVNILQKYAVKQPSPKEHETYAAINAMMNRFINLSLKLGSNSSWASWAYKSRRRVRRQSRIGSRHPRSSRKGFWSSMAPLRTRSHVALHILIPLESPVLRWRLSRRLERSGHKAW